MLVTLGGQRVNSALFAFDTFTNYYSSNFSSLLFGLPLPLT